MLPPDALHNRILEFVILRRLDKDRRSRRRSEPAVAKTSGYVDYLSIDEQQPVCVPYG